MNLSIKIRTDINLSGLVANEQKCIWKPCQEIVRRKYVGCGAHMSLNGEQICHKQWTKEESQSSSTWRELSAIEYALESFLPILNHAYVKWFSDSQTACSIARVGSMKKDLQLSN
jgi:hypothetical protein